MSDSDASIVSPREPEVASSASTVESSTVESSTVESSTVESSTGESSTGESSTGESSTGRERPSAPDGSRQSDAPDITAPFLLERSNADLSTVAAEARAKPAKRAPVLAMARRLGVLALLNATLYAAITVAGVLRYWGDRSAIPEVVAAIMALALTVWGTLTGYHLLRASQGKANAGHQLAGAFSNLRSIFILKGTGLFLVLALSCFAFSAIFSLFALF